MQLLKGLLERWAKLVEQAGLASVDGIATTRRCAYHTEKRVRRRIDFVRMIPMILCIVISICSAASEACVSSVVNLEKEFVTNPPRPIMVTCFGSC
jgi:hypothetical protein